MSEEIIPKFATGLAIHIASLFFLTTPESLKMWFLPALQPRFKDSAVGCKAGASYPPRRLACALEARRRQRG